MFDFENSDLDDLTTQQREDLAQILQARRDMLNATLQENELRLSYVMNQSPQALRDLKAHIELNVIPLRAKHTKLVGDLLSETISLDKIMELLPMMVLGALQGVNLPLVFTALGLDSDHVDYVIGMIGRYTNLGKS